VDEIPLPCYELKRQEVMSETRQFIRLRYAARCVNCGADLPPRSEAHWDKEARAATCRTCVEATQVTPPSPPPDAFTAPQPADTDDAQSAVEEPIQRLLERGTPGASAAREWTRRHERREKQVHDQYGRLSGIYLAFTDDPQSTRAWATGSNGEHALGNYLATLDDDATIIVLHDRRIPGTRANIDHIAITRNGIHAIDAKNYTGKVQRIDKGGWFSTDLHLYVGRRNCTKLISGMAKQVEAIKTALGQPFLEKFSLDVRPSLCFVDAEWALFAKPLGIEGVWIGWSKALGERLRAEGPLTPEHVRLIAERVAAALPGA
jgi:hypothetical protein